MDLVNLKIIEGLGSSAGILSFSKGNIDFQLLFLVDGSIVSGCDSLGQKAQGESLM